ncbi:MAG: ribosomal-processing cysteine protease Prp [Clostridia bacterium]|nr:ribosomal-processing cysteine protease Prp [Clostridia bacterium]
MTILRVYRKGKQFIGFECSGHSGYAEEGSDIVCAAISTAVQYCVNCAEKIDHVPLQLTVEQERALIRCMAKEPNKQFSKHIEILVELGQSIAEEYAMYFNLEILEV